MAYKSWVEDVEVPSKYKEHSCSFQLVNQADEAQELLDRARQQKVIAVDTETDGLDHTASKIIGVCLSIDDQTGYYLPFRHMQGKNLPEELMGGVIEACERAEEVRMFNARFDLRMLENEGLEVEQCDYFDGSVLLYNADMNLGKFGFTGSNGALNLKGFIRSVLGWELVETDVTKFPYLDPEVKIYEYGGKDSLSTYLIPEVFEDVREKLDFTIRLDNKTLRMIKEMEEVPKRVDKDHFHELRDQLNQKKRLQEQLAYESIGHQINLGSDHQVRGWLKDEGIDTGNETEKGAMQVDKDSLKGIKDKHDAIPHLLKVREYNKQESTYIKPYIGEESDQSGLFGDNDTGGIEKFYFAYKTTTTRSGRLSSGADDKNDFFNGGNAQNLTKSDKGKFKLKEGGPLLGYEPVEVEGDEYDFEGQTLDFNIRHGIKPQKGMLWVSLDYSGQELRILANETKDPKLLNEFSKDDPDLHTLVLEKVLGKFEGDFDRGQAKTLTYALLYGSGAGNIMHLLDVDYNTAEEIIEEWWEVFEGAKAYKREKIGQLKKKGFVSNRFGRIRWMDYMLEQGNEASAERNAVNTPIQSAGGDIMKIGALRAWENVVKPSGGEVVPEFQVHDENNYSVVREPAKLKDYVYRLKDHMEISLPGWPVDFPVDVSIGLSFGEQVPLKVYSKDEVWLADKFVI